MTNYYHKILNDSNELPKKHEHLDAVVLFAVAPAKKTPISTFLNQQKSGLNSDLDALNQYARASESNTEAGMILTLDSSPIRTASLVFLPAAVEMFDLLKQARKIMATLQERKRRNILVKFLDVNKDGVTKVCDALVSAQVAANFDSPKFSKKDKAKDAASKKIDLSILVKKEWNALLTKVCDHAAEVTKATNLARELAMLPANILDCKAYVKRAQELAKEQKLKTEFFGIEKLKTMKAGAFAAVAQGSS